MTPAPIKLDQRASTVHVIVVNYASTSFSGSADYFSNRWGNIIPHQREKYNNKYLCHCPQKTGGTISVETF